MYSMYILLTLHFRKKFLKTFKYILSGTIEIFYPVHTINCTAECKEYFFLKENAFFTLYSDYMVDAFEYLGMLENKYINTNTKTCVVPSL